MAEKSGGRHTGDTIGRYPVKDVSNASLGQLRPPSIDTLNAQQKQFSSAVVARGMEFARMKAQERSGQGQQRAAPSRSPQVQPAQQIARTEGLSLQAIAAHKGNQERVQARSQQQGKEQGHGRGK